MNYMSFATSPSISEVGNGDCLLLVKKIEKILPLACRYHILELLIGQAFEVTVENVLIAALFLFIDAWAQ